MDDPKEEGNEDLAAKVIRLETELATARAENEAKTEELRVVEQGLLHEQRLDTLGMMTSEFAHDFNNLLTAMGGFNELIGMSIGKKSSLRTYVEDSAKACEKARVLVNNMLGYGRKYTFCTAVCSVETIINDALDLLRFDNEKINIIKVFPDSLYPINADKHQMHQVILNLCTNSVHAMTEGGRLLITAENVDVRDGDIAYLNMPQGEYVRILISDTGHGMDDATLKRVFEPFYTTKAEGKGTGLGMYIVQRILKQHRGFIDISSEQGNGTDINLYLPMSAEPLEEGLVKIKRTDLSGKETILVAEGDDLVMSFAKYVLEDNGYNVLTASDGKVATYTYLTGRDAINLIFLDSRLPIKRGSEVLAAIHDHGLSPKVIVTSGAPDLDGENFYGAIRLHKPYSIDNLLSAVRHSLDSKDMMPDLNNP